MSHRLSRFSCLTFSGHITMDAQQARFFQEIMAKDHKYVSLAMIFASSLPPLTTLRPTLPLPLLLPPTLALTSVH